MQLDSKFLRRDLVIGVVTIVLVAFLEGLYAVNLNAVYYNSYSPFYDSISYYNQLAFVMQYAHDGNLGKALEESLKAANTTLPFLEAIVLGIFKEPTRAVGTWLQIFWLAVLGISVFFYIRKFHVNDFFQAIALTLPFIGISALWLFNGGLSDFRMDLHLYLLTAISFMWFLCSYYTERIYPWLLCGIFMGITCLARTIAPVYLFASLSVPLTVRFIFPTNLSRLKLSRNVALMCLLAISVCGWFYIFNFKSMYYYYVIWNPDANAKLPLLESLKHFDLAFQNIGWYPHIFSVFLLPFTLTTYLKRKKAVRLFKDIDWKVLWIGLAPIFLLVFRGAGFNPFVSMPSAFGLILFFLRPLKPSSEDTDVIHSLASG